MVNYANQFDDKDFDRLNKRLEDHEKTFGLPDSQFLDTLLQKSPEVRARLILDRLNSLKTQEDKNQFSETVDNVQGIMTDDVDNWLDYYIEKQGGLK
jgi:hypothetical protein